MISPTNELLADLDNGKVKLESIARKDLPTELQTLNDTELKETIVKKQQERNEILGRVNRLNQEREVYLKNQAATATKADSFDEKVFTAVRAQAAQKGFKY